jgi:predicted phage terminase large subunit-like protein
VTDLKAQQRLLDQRKLVAKAAAREEMAREARDSLVKYIWFTMPHPSDPDDVTLSRYTITPQARLLCQIIEKIARGEPLTEHGDKNAAISIGPQTGKSEIISRRGPAWLFGRNPTLNAILGSYNQDFANEFGDDVGSIIRSDQHRQVFPAHALRKGGNAKDLLISTDGGKLAFVGVGGSGTGKPADVFIVDDPIRNDDDAQSEVYRDRTWNWFTKVASTRIHNESAMVVVHTRWHEDDLIGRLCDPEHPERGKKYAGVAEDWLHINIPAIVEDPALAKALGLTLRVQQNDLVRAQFGTKPIAALWPERFSLEFLAKQKRLDKRGFTALRMGKPAPEDGDYFKADWLVPYYSVDDLPKRLQMYGSSDHAATEKRKNDASVIGCVGVDEKDDIWVMPDLIWDRMETDGIVESLLTQFKTHKPLLWWLEDENISKSFGPFLMKRMQEERTYVTLDGISRITDKRQHARSIQGRLQMKKVHFPVFASWWPDARNEMLKFPFGTHDDFVDFIANVGQGMNKQSMASREPAADNVIKVGSMAWILAQTRKREGKEKRERASASF